MTSVLQTQIDTGLTSYIYSGKSTNWSVFLFFLIVCKSPVLNSLIYRLTPDDLLSFIARILLANISWLQLIFSNYSHSILSNLISWTNIFQVNTGVMPSNQFKHAIKCNVSWKTRSDPHIFHPWVGIRYVKEKCAIYNTALADLFIYYICYY